MNPTEHFDTSLLDQLQIQVYEPFAHFLKSSEREYRFSISLLDVVRLAGHACPSMIGAFLTTREAVRQLYPDTETCVRGQLRVALPGKATDGATGPIANVISYITGAWGESGFGGLNGHYQRRNLLQFGDSRVPMGHFRFTRTDTGESLDVIYRPDRVIRASESTLDFQTQWRIYIQQILTRKEDAITVKRVTEAEAAIVHT